MRKSNKIDAVSVGVARRVPSRHGAAKAAFGLAWSIVCILASICPASAEIRTVGPLGEGGDSRANGQNLALAISTLQDGDVLMVGGGLYEIEPKLTLWVDEGFEHAGGIVISNLSNVAIRAASQTDRPVVFGRGVGNHLLIQSCTNLVLDGLVFRGDRPEVVTNLFSAVFLNGPNEGILVENCRLEDFGNHGISHLIPPMESKGVVITNNVFERGGDLHVEFMRDSDGAAVSGIGKGWVVGGNRFVDCVRGVEVEGHITEAHDIVIDSNHFEGTSNIAIMVFPTSGVADDFARIQILNNTITNSIWVRHLPVYPDYYTTGIFIGGGKDILVQSNTVVGTQGTGLLATSSFCELRNTVIQGNVFDRSNGTGVIIVDHPSTPLAGVSLRDNQILLSGVRGAFVSGQDLEIVGNVFDSNAWLGDFSALRIEGSNTIGAVVHGNYFTNSAPALYQMRGIRIAEGVPPVWLAGNQFDQLIATTIDAPSNSIRLDPISSIQLYEGRPLLGYTTQGRQLLAVWTADSLDEWRLLTSFWSDESGVGTYAPGELIGPMGFFKLESLSLER